MLMWKKESESREGPTYAKNYKKLKNAESSFQEREQQFDIQCPMVSPENIQITLYRLSRLYLGIYIYMIIYMKLIHVFTNTTVNNI